MYVVGVTNEILAAMFDFDVLVISMSKSIRTCPAVLLYLEHVGLAV